MSADLPRLVRLPCERQGFAGHPASGTCEDCRHMIMAHVGCESCVVCRMEYQLSPAEQRQQARMQGREPWR